MDVSKSRGIPKWMVKIMVPNPIKMHDLGGFPCILVGHTHFPLFSWPCKGSQIPNQSWEVGFNRSRRMDVRWVDDVFSPGERCKKIPTNPWNRPQESPKYTYDSGFSS